MKTELQLKKETVQQYILMLKGRHVKINFKQGVDNSQELEMLNHAYGVAVSYFRRNQY